MSSEEGKNRTGASHRPYDEAFKRRRRGGAVERKWQKRRAGQPGSLRAWGVTTESLRACGDGSSPGGQAESPTAAEGETASRRAERAGVGGGGAPTARAASERDQPARHFKKGRRDFRRPKRERFRCDRSHGRLLSCQRSLRGPSTCRARGLLRLASTRVERARPGRCYPWGEQIGALFVRSRRTYGSPRLHRALRRAGHVCGRHRVARLTRGRGLAGRLRGRRRPWTTDSDHAQPIAPNQLGRREQPVERPDEVWGKRTSPTWPTAEGWLYLAGVLDLGSRRLVGWAMGESLETSLPMDALRMALGQRRPKTGLLHHSDRGCQYASEAYREYLAA